MKIPRLLTGIVAGSASHLQGAPESRLRPFHVPLTGRVLVFSDRVTIRPESGAHSALETVMRYVNPLRVWTQGHSSFSFCVKADGYRGSA
jgi:hypothetical protein